MSLFSHDSYQLPAFSTESPCHKIPGPFDCSQPSFPLCVVTQLCMFLKDCKLMPLLPLLSLFFFFLLKELIPLILCTACLHPEPKERDQLLHILFNLIKRPDDEQRLVKPEVYTCSLVKADKYYAKTEKLVLSPSAAALVWEFLMAYSWQASSRKIFFHLRGVWQLLCDRLQWVELMQ